MYGLVKMTEIKKNQNALYILFYYLLYMYILQQIL